MFKVGDLVRTTLFFPDERLRGVLTRIRSVSFQTNDPYPYEILIGTDMWPVNSTEIELAHPQRITVTRKKGVTDE